MVHSCNSFFYSSVIFTIRQLYGSRLANVTHKAFICVSQQFSHTVLFTHRLWRRNKYSTFLQKAAQGLIDSAILQWSFLTCPYWQMPQNCGLHLPEYFPPLLLLMKQRISSISSSRTTALTTPMNQPCVAKLGCISVTSLDGERGDGKKRERCVVIVKDDE